MSNNSKLSFEEIDQLILDNIISLNEQNIDKFVIKHGWTRSEMLIEYEKRQQESKK